MTKSGRYSSQKALSWAATCHSPMFCHLQNFVTGASHKSNDRPSLPPPGFHASARSTIAYHPRPRHTEQISSIQVRTRSTKARTRSVPFVPQHVGSTGAKWSAMVESSQCFLVAPRLDVKVYGQCTSSFRSSDLYNLR